MPLGPDADFVSVEIIDPHRLQWKAEYAGL